MKTGLMLSVVLVMAALGCGKSHDDRMVDLEKRIAMLEGRLAMLEHRSFEPSMRMPVRRMEDRKDDMALHHAPLTSEQIAERQKMREDVRKRLEERREKARAKKAGTEAVKDSVGK